LPEDLMETANDGNGHAESVRGTIERGPQLDLSKRTRRLWFYSSSEKGKYDPAAKVAPLSGEKAMKARKKDGNDPKVLSGKKFCSRKNREKAHPLEKARISLETAKGGREEGLGKPGRRKSSPLKKMCPADLRGGRLEGRSRKEDARRFCTGRKEVSNQVLEEDIKGTDRPSSEGTREARWGGEEVRGEELGIRGGRGRSAKKELRKRRGKGESVAKKKKEGGPGENEF